MTLDGRMINDNVTAKDGRVMIDSKQNKSQIRSLLPSVASPHRRQKTWHDLFRKPVSTSMVFLNRNHTLMQAQNNVPLIIFCNFVSKKNLQFQKKGKETIDVNFFFLSWGWAINGSFFFC